MKITSELLSAFLGISSLPNFSANRISIDSRNITGSELFVAINKGHEFVKHAIDSGAIAAIIDDKKFEIPDKTILVDNTTEALKLIGQSVKNKIGLKKLIAITGSAGKTTTKSWLNTILKHRFNSFSGVGNYNTIYGLPIALSLLEEGTEFGIFEIGSNHSGEISELSKYLNPDIGIITNIYESHIGNFGDKASIAREKISIIDGIKNGGVLIFDGDSEFADEIKFSASPKNLKTFSVGFSRNCDFEILSWDRIIELKTPAGNLEYEVSFLGKHFAYMTASICATIYAMGLNINEFLPFFKELSQIEGRGNIKNYEFQGKIFEVINDAYNASPAAMFASLETLQTYHAASKIAVIGQMKELGKYEQYYHKLIADKLNSMNIDKVFFIGDESLWPIMNKEGNVACFEEINNFVIEKILTMVQNNSVVLLKGSHSVGLEKFIKYLECSTV